MGKTKIEGTDAKIILECSKTKSPIFEPSEIYLKTINFIYGKNGTGKSTISNLVQEQCSSEYDIRCFNGFAGFLDTNESLNAITLGNSNTEAQKKINKINDEIIELQKKTQVLENERQIKSNKFEKKNKELQEVYKKSARFIKNKSNPQISSTSYNAKTFEDEINEAKLLADSDIEKNKNECRADFMNEPSHPNYPSIDISELTKEVNTLLTRSISATIEPRGIGDSAEKQAFAKQGMKVHDRETDRYCAFCGNSLTEERWKELDSLFNNLTNQFQNELDKKIKQIKIIQETVEKIILPDPEQYYTPYREQIQQLYNVIVKNKINVIDYLGKMLEKLNKREQNLFVVMDPLQLEIPEWNAQALQQTHNKILENNNTYGANLHDKIEEARKRLRHHYIAIQLNEYNYYTLREARDNAETEYTKSKQEVKKVQDKILTLRKQRDSLIEETSSEQIAATQINKSLQSLGSTSFELKLFEDSSAAKGQYRIVSDGEERSIKTLSTGEKNLVAFLYFMQHLKERDPSNKPMLVVMDDPMNSNDESSQYLMYSYIQRFYGEKKKDKAQKYENDIFILLTHNTHFFLNCRPYGWTPKEKRIACFALYKRGKYTKVISIDKDENDIKTGYIALWNEFKYAYTKEKPGFMWNPLRRIITTFSNFNGVPSLEQLINDLHSNDADCSIAGEIKKGMDVNSHELYDIEVDPNGYNPEEILNFARWYFTKIGHKEHFEHFFEQKTIK